MGIVGGVLSFYLLQKLAALLAVGSFLLAGWIKDKISHMDGEKWDQYFRTLSNRGYVAVFFVFYTVPHLALGWAGYLLYSHFRFPAPAVLALLIPLLGILKAVRMLDENKEKLWAKIRKLG